MFAGDVDPQTFRGENGSGLTRRNKASPVSVVRLLDSMLDVDTDASAETLSVEAPNDAPVVPGRVLVKMQPGSETRLSAARLDSVPELGLHVIEVMPFEVV